MSDTNAIAEALIKIGLEQETAHLAPKACRRRVGYKEPR